MNYKYLVYVGESGWGITDHAFLITENGIVNFIKGACRRNYLPKEIINNQNIITKRSLKIDYVPDNLVTIDKDIIDNIEDIPKKVIGMDGSLCTLYRVGEDILEKIWSVEDYDQIPITKAVYDKIRSVNPKYIF